MNRRRWILWSAAALIAVWLLGTYGVSRLLLTRRVHRALAARLEAAFGRPVEVSRFDLSLFGAPRLQAEYITVEEDPRYGAEYFLRAERMTASLRWRSLLLGRLEFGTLAFKRPSLNVVRASDGSWNVVEWLRGSEPRPKLSPLPEKFGPVGRGERRVRVEAGRINFKRGVDKLAFALLDLDGTVDLLEGGRWRLDLEARPMRAGVILQEAGTLRVQGGFLSEGAGASDGNPAAALDFSWQDASLSDALRLLRGQDFGIRGRLTIQGSVVSAESEAAAWDFNLTARLSGAHRWDLPARAADPPLNLSAEGGWWPRQSQIEIRKGVLEGPRSSLRISGRLRYPDTREDSAESAVRLASSGIDLADLLAWHRAFRLGVADDLLVEGNAGMDVSLSGWPPRPEKGVVVTDGARILVGAGTSPWQIGKTVFRLAPEKIQLQPVVIRLAPAEPEESAAISSAAAWTISGAMTLSAAPQWQFSLSGQTPRLENFISSLAAFGFHPIGDWKALGAASARLRWEGTGFPIRGRVTGSAELKAAELRAPFLNFPVKVVAAKMAFRNSERRITLSSAEAFGANWKGTLNAKSAGAPWEFSLSADRLDASEFDHWMNPSARGADDPLTSALARQERPDNAALAARGAIRASGKLNAGELHVAALTLRKLSAEVRMDGGNPWMVDVSSSSDFYSGTVQGRFSAQGAPDSPSGNTPRNSPAFRAELAFRRVDLETLTVVSPGLAGRFSGSLEGQLKLTTAGYGRPSLVQNLVGSGSVRGRNAAWQDVNIPETFLREKLIRGPGPPRDFDVQIRIGATQVSLDHLRVQYSAGDLQLTGKVGPGLFLLLNTAPGKGEWGLAGSLLAPQWARVSEYRKP